MIFRFLQFLLRSGNEHAVHSPFVYELYTKVIHNKKAGSPDFALIERLRKRLHQSRQKIKILDLGAGSRISANPSRSVSSIANTAEKPPRFGKLFFRLVSHFQPKTLLELGTSLGITTLYFAKAAPLGKVTTMEGCPETSRIASEIFENANCKNINLVVGNIDETLPGWLDTLSAPLDMVYFDANHRYEPTVRYFELCLNHLSDTSVFIFDDIHWSEEMHRAWEEIKTHPKVSVTIDLFWIGLVFFRKEQAKEHFTLRL